MPEGASSSLTVRGRDLSALAPKGGNGKPAARGTYISWCRQAAYPCWERKSPAILSVPPTPSLTPRRLARPGRRGETHDHLAVLGDPDALALHDLDVVQAAQDLVLDAEGGGHGELCALLDLEGLVLEGALAPGRGEVDGNWAAAGRVHGQGLDDADAGVAGVGEVLAAGEAEGLLVALEGLIVRVCMGAQEKESLAIIAGSIQSVCVLFRLGGDLVTLAMPHSGFV